MESPYCLWGLAFMCCICSNYFSGGMSSSILLKRRLEPQHDLVTEKHVDFQLPVAQHSNHDFEASSLDRMPETSSGEETSTVLPSLDLPTSSEPDSQLLTLPEGTPKAHVTGMSQIQPLTMDSVNVSVTDVPTESSSMGSQAVPLGFQDPSEFEMSDGLQDISLMESSQLQHFELYPLDVDSQRHPRAETWSSNIQSLLASDVQISQIQQSDLGFQSLPVASAPQMDYPDFDFQSLSAVELPITRQNPHLQRNSAIQDVPVQPSSVGFESPYAAQSSQVQSSYMDFQNLPAELFWAQQPNAPGQGVPSSPLVFDSQSLPVQVQPSGLGFQSAFDADPVPYLQPSELGVQHLSSDEVFQMLPSSYDVDSFPAAQIPDVWPMRTDSQSFSDVQMLPSELGFNSGAAANAPQANPSGEVQFALMQPFGYQRFPAAQEQPSKVISRWHSDADFFQRQTPIATKIVQNEQHLPVKLDSVKAECSETSVRVHVRRDLLGIGQLIQPSDVTLGGCPLTGQDAAGQLLFEAQLYECGSNLKMTEEALIYNFSLTYIPNGLRGTPIVRTNGAVVSVECHYLRKHNVSSNALRPTWIPSFATRSSEERLLFSLRLMKDDWTHERDSNVFFLGDFLNIEASVLQAKHQPLRVFVDSCVASLSPDKSALPRYAFINNHGCFLDPKLTGSYSTFLPRTQNDKLQIKLSAFRFPEDTKGSIYFICHMRATPVSEATTFGLKACSFSVGENRWIDADGNDQACSCCETNCVLRRKARSVHKLDLQLEGEALLGPLIIREEIPNDALRSPILTGGVSTETMAFAGAVATAGLLCAVLVSVWFCRTCARVQSFE